MGDLDVLTPERRGQAGYKVDVTRGERVGRVSSEWFSRPADERFLSLTELFASVNGRAERSRTRTVESAAVRVEARRDDLERLAPHVDITRDTTTLYASDRDVFLFLVDDLNPIEAGGCRAVSPTSTSGVSLSRPDFGRRRAQLASSMAVRPPALPARSVLDGSEHGVTLVQIGMPGSDVWR